MLFMFYAVGRSYLIELYYSQLQSHQVRIVDGHRDARERGLSTLARQNSTMISAYQAPCWRGRRGIRT
jgi:hypothetical protein